VHLNSAGATKGLDFAEEGSLCHWLFTRGDLTGINDPHSSNQAGATFLQPPSNPSNRSTKLIVMGLPKTGTTSVARALLDLNLSVAHNQGDQLPFCDAIANTLENKYEHLAKMYPFALWVVTYAAFDDWFSSALLHEESTGCRWPSSLRALCGSTDALWIERTISANTGLSPPQPASAEFRANCSTSMRASRPYLREAHRLYYTRLRYFLSHRHHAWVDVRRGAGWRELEHAFDGRVLPPSWDIPLLKTNAHQGKAFPKWNTAGQRGGWPKCRVRITEHASK